MLWIDPRGAVALILFCTLLVATLPACAQSPAHSPAPARSPTLGRSAPDFTLPDVDGRNRSLADFRGRPVALFVFCGCDPCHRCARAWGQVQRDAAVPTPPSAPGKGAASRPDPLTLVVFLGDAPAARQFAAATGLDPARTVLLTDPETRVAAAYDAEPCPRVFALDARGVLRYTNTQKDDAPPDAPAATIVSRAWAALQGSPPGAPARPSAPRRRQTTHQKHEKARTS